MVDPNGSNIPDNRWIIWFWQLWATHHAPATSHRWSGYMNLGIANEWFWDTNAGFRVTIGVVCIWWFNYHPKFNCRFWFTDSGITNGDVGFTDEDFRCWLEVFTDVINGVDKEWVCLNWWWQLFKDSDLGITWFQIGSGIITMHKGVLYSNVQMVNSVVDNGWGVIPHKICHDI